MVRTGRIPNHLKEWTPRTYQALHGALCKERIYGLPILRKVTV